MKKKIFKTWRNILAEVGRKEMLMMGYTLKKKETILTKLNEARSTSRKRIPRFFYIPLKAFLYKNQLLFKLYSLTLLLVQRLIE